MRKIVLVILFFIFFSPHYGEINSYRKGNLIIENIPDIPNTLIEELSPYQNVRSASFRDWLPGEQGMLISTRFEDARQIHRVEMPKGTRQQLTYFTEPIGYGIVCPDSQKPVFLFTKDSAGNEVHQIYKYNYRTNSYHLLTDGESKYSSLVWSHRGDKFAFASTMRNGQDYDIYIGTVEGRTSFQALIEKGGYWSAVDFSPDDQKLIVEEYISTNESHYYILDLITRHINEINPTEERISYGNARWSRDDKAIYMISDQFSEFKQLLYYDLDSKKIDVLTQSIPWDIKDFELSPSGDTIVFTSNENGFTSLYFLNTKTQKITQVRLPRGQIYGLKFKPDGEQLAFVINTPQSPSDVYSLNLKTKKLVRWTYSEVVGLDTTQFIHPHVFHYETFDSVDGQPRAIPAFYYRPKKFQPPYPVLIMCHGGPASQYIPYFSTTIQFYLNEMGIAYIAPSIRGSSGYGKRFMTLDDEYRREDAVRDIGALLEWIEKQPELDAARIGIMGGSYGGYMVLAALAHYSDRLRCGIDEWGISNFVTFLKNTGKYRQDLRRAEYGDERIAEMQKFLNEISPLTNAHKITKPLFIVQGLNDPRVPVSEAEQIKEAVRQNEVDVWYLLAEDEGHGFGKKSNWLFSRQAEILFLKKYLLQ